MTRRELLKAVSVPMAMSIADALSAKTSLDKFGIATTSFGAAAQARRAAQSPAGRVAWDTHAFLEHCHSLGAAGIQAQINGDIPKLRTRAEQLGMYVEAMVSLPRNGDASGFEKSLRDAKAAGATVLRTAALSGRRYETFATLADWNKFVSDTRTALDLAVPLVEKYKLYLALENHKDWTADEAVELLKAYSSEYLGACLDFGNNISLLDSPTDLVEKSAPYAVSTHIKDMGVASYEDGFLLSEVPLGMGLLDLPHIVSTISKARPKTRFLLEMMTRDPLRVPCLTDKYWEVFPGRSGQYLARTLRLVRTQGWGEKPLPRVAQLPLPERVRIEEDNVKACLTYTREKLSA